MAEMHPPMSKAVVGVPDSLKDRYVAAGWTDVEKPKAAPERASKSEK